MPAWGEAQYVIDELGKKIEGGGLTPPKLNNFSTVDIVFIKNKVLMLKVPLTTKPDSILIGNNTILTVEGFQVRRFLKNDRSEYTREQGVLIGKSLYSWSGETSRVIIDEDVPKSGILIYAFFVKTHQRWSSFDPDQCKEINVDTISENQFIVTKVLSDTADPVSRCVLQQNGMFSQTGENGGMLYWTGLRKTNESKDSVKNWLSSTMLHRYILTHVLKNYPAAVNDDGTVRYWLDPKDYTKKIDGTESDWNNPDFDGNFCAWINRNSVCVSSFDNDHGFGIFLNETVNARELHKIDPVFCDWNDNICEGIWFPMKEISSKHAEIIRNLSMPEAVDYIRNLNNISNRRFSIGWVEYQYLNMLMILFNQNTNIYSTISSNSDKYGSIFDGFKSDGTQFHIVDSPLCHLYLFPFTRFKKKSNGEYDMLSDIRHKYEKNITDTIPVMDLLNRNHFLNESVASFPKIWSYGDVCSDPDLNPGHYFIVPYRRSGYQNGSSSTYYCDYIAWESVNMVVGDEYGIYNGTIISNGIVQVDSGPWMSTWSSNAMNDSTKKFVSADRCFIGLLPPPDYDPFEATNYHPWENWLDESQIQDFI